MRFTLEELGARAPGRSVEVRVHPFGAVQCIEGPPTPVAPHRTSWRRMPSPGSRSRPALGSGPRPWRPATCGSASLSRASFPVASAADSRSSASATASASACSVGRVPSARDRASARATLSDALVSTRAACVAAASASRRRSRPSRARSVAAPSASAVSSDRAASAGRVSLSTRPTSWPTQSARTPHASTRSAGSSVGHPHASRPARLTRNCRHPASYDARSSVTRAWASPRSLRATLRAASVSEARPSAAAMPPRRSARNDARDARSAPGWASASERSRSSSVRWLPASWAARCVASLSASRTLRSAALTAARASNSAALAGARSSASRVAGSASTRRSHTGQSSPTVSCVRRSAARPAACAACTCWAASSRTRWAASRAVCRAASCAPAASRSTARRPISSTTDARCCSNPSDWRVSAASPA
nr:sterol carrier family protein [Propioniciclava sinopodophylli]